MPSNFADKIQLTEKEIQFYEETDPGKRLAMLESADGLEQTELRRHFFKLRHPDRRCRNDLYMRMFLDFKYFTDQDVVPLSANTGKIREEYAKMGQLLAKDNGETGAHLFYWELRNAVKRYFETTSQKGQGRKLFGIMAPDEEHRHAFRSEEAWKMSVGLVTKYHLEKEMYLLVDAVVDAYAATDEDAAKRLEDYDKMHRPDRKAPLYKE